MLPYARAGPPPHLSEAVAHGYNTTQSFGRSNLRGCCNNDSFIFNIFPGHQ
jgi:hypothetical protein